MRKRLLVTAMMAAGLTPAIARDVPYSHELGVRNEMIETALTDAVICMHDGAKAALMQGQRDHDDIVVFEVKSCAVGLVPILSRHGVPMKKVNALLQEMAEDELKAVSRGR